MKATITLFFLFIAVTIHAQSRMGLMLGGGVLYYKGEMNDRVVTHEKLLRPYANVGILYRLSSRFDVWGNFMHGSVVGADSLAIKYSLRNRNLSFKTSVDEASINIGFRLLGDRKGKLKAFPYLFAGIAGYHFKPKAELGGSWVDLQSTGTEGQYINEGNYPRPYELYQISVPAGIGVEIKLSKEFALRLEAARHFLFTDYFDDVSSNYPDSASLSATPNGEIAVALSSRSIDGGFLQNGTARGNVKTNDSFTHIGVALLWTPVKGSNESSGSKKKKKKRKCDAYHT